MKTAALVALSLLSLSIVGVGCSESPEPTSSSRSASKPSSDEKDDSADKEVKSTSTVESKNPEPDEKPKPQAKPDAKDNQAESPCVKLGECCTRLTNAYVQLACIAVEVHADPAACQVSLVGCLADVEGTDSSGIDDKKKCNLNGDCPGDQICVGKVCVDPAFDP